MKKYLYILLLLCLRASILKAQILTPVKWAYAVKKVTNKEAVVLLKASIDNGWHIYSQTSKEGGPVKTSFSFSPSKDYVLYGKVIEPKPVTKFEPVFNMAVSYFEQDVVFQQRLKLKSDKPGRINGTLRYMTCNEQKCLPPDEINFSIPFPGK